MFKPLHFNRPRLPSFALGLAALVLTGSGAMATGAVTTATAKVFNGPLPGAAFIATVPAGIRVGVVWCGKQSQWCLISFHAKQGFVSAAALRLLDGSADNQLASVGGSAGNRGGGQAIPSVSTPDEPRSLAESLADNGGGDTGGGIKITKPLQPLH